MWTKLRTWQTINMWSLSPLRRFLIGIFPLPQSPSCVASYWTNRHCKCIRWRPMMFGLRCFQSIPGRSLSRADPLDLSLEVPKHLHTVLSEGWCLGWFWSLPFGTHSGLLYGFTFLNRTCPPAPTRVSSSASVTQCTSSGNPKGLNSSSPLSLFRGEKMGGRMVNRSCLDLIWGIFWISTL